ncbi:glycosyltransferase family 2 protein [Hansschlegelia beijingensis]|uniref:glycosyltransferase family 2 protein n=1 Tax=Hansschlegelia beijingensis TaxID=1133344 RepID=UPI00387EE98A
MKPRLSVIITSYNIEKYIERAICSVVDQGFDGVEIILVDDGSTDRTVELASNLLRSEPRVKIILQANAGPGAARNKGIRHANGEYVIFLDGDDWFAPRALHALRASAADGVDLVLSNRRRFWERSGLYTTKPMFTELKTGNVSELPEVMKIQAIHGKMFRRKFLNDRKILFPEGMSSEDFVFSYSVYAAAELATTIPDVTYIYRKRCDSNNQSLTQARLSEFNLLSRFKQIEMTLGIVAAGELKRRFPKTNFLWLEYQARLMRHVKLIPKENDADRRLWALEQLRVFLKKHRKEALANCRPATKRVYQLILSKKYDEAMSAIQQANNTN